MSTYVDGFVLPLPKDRIEDYRRLAEQSAAIWKEHGALEYFEAVGDDLETTDMVSFSKLAGAGPDETVVFAWITFRSREHRDEVNAKIMNDPRLREMCHAVPFDYTRMAYGGFRIFVGN